MNRPLPPKPRCISRPNPAPLLLVVVLMFLHLPSTKASTPPALSGLKALLPAPR